MNPGDLGLSLLVVLQLPRARKRFRFDQVSDFLEMDGPLKAHDETWQVFESIVEAMGWWKTTLRKWITSDPKNGISMMISDYFDRKWHLQTNHWCSGVNSLRFFFLGVIPQKSSREILGEFSYWSQGVTWSVSEILGEFWERHHKNKSVDPLPQKKTFVFFGLSKGLLTMGFP